MKHLLLAFLGVICLLGSVAQGQTPQAPSKVQLFVKPEKGTTPQVYRTVPLVYPLLDSIGDTLHFKNQVSIELTATLPNHNKVSKVHLEIGGLIGGVYFPELITSFPIDGPGNMYATYQRIGGRVRFGLSQNMLGEYTYKVWVEDLLGNLSPATEASVFHFSQ